VRLKVFEGYFPGPPGTSGFVKTQNLQDVFTVQTRSAERSKLDSKIPRSGAVISIAVGIDFRDGDQYRKKGK